MINKSIIFGFDNNKNLEVMKINNNQLESIETKTLIIPDDIKNKYDYSEMLQAGIDLFLSSNKGYKNNFNVMLPNELVCIDYFKFPNISVRNLAETLKINISERYVNYKDLIILKDMDSENKKQIGMRAVVCSKNVIDKIKKTMKSNKLNVRYLSTNSAGLCNSVLTLRPKYKKTNFMFIDLKDKYCDIVFASKDKVKGFTTIPFGNNVLTKDKVLSEYELVDNAVAELAVLNAKEMAKSKKLTISIDRLNEEELELGDESYLEERNGEKVLIKKPKVFPKFMRREIPQEENEILIENFRIILKKILIYLKNEELNGFNINHVIINMDYQFKFIIDHLNEEYKDEIFDFALFKNEKDRSDVFNHLSLFGAVNLKKYNKVMVF